MTQRERIDEHRAEVYETPLRPAQRPTNSGTSAYDVDVVTPTDRVRWGPIIAGLFAALSTLAVMSVLGLALGASAFDPGDRAINFGIGAGIWGAVSALLAFLVGGFTAARTAAVGGRNNGLLNGTMVWVVAIPLLLYALTSGIGLLVGTAGRAAATAAQVAAPAAGQLADNAGAQASAAAAAGGAAQAAEGVASAAAVAATDPANQAAAADAVRNGAWGALGTLLLSLGAAAGGGAVGARRVDERRAVVGS